MAHRHASEWWRDLVDDSDMTEADFANSFSWEPDYEPVVEALPVAPALEPLPITCMASLHDVEIPPRDWIVPGWIPSKAVTLLAGGGAVGKSLFTQQLLTCIALGVSCLGLPASPPMPTLFVNCEDEEEELARRNQAIADALQERVSSFADVYTLSRAGALGNDLGTFDDKRNFHLSQLFRQIEADAIRLGVRCIGLDNVAHMFTGNENVRGEATQFTNACLRLAIAIDGAVILLGHPAKIDGSQYSGSTAWENSVRARLFLSRPEDKEGQPANPDHRILTSGKVNYSAKGAAVEMMWSKGAFVPMSDAEDDVATDPSSAAGHHNEAFLKCLAIVTEQRRAVSHTSRSGNYAPRIFSEMPAGKRVGKHNFVLAMERLLALEIIAVEQKLWAGKNRHPVLGIARCG